MSFLGIFFLLYIGQITTVGIFKGFKSGVEKQTGMKIEAIRSDNGSELLKRQNETGSLFFWNNSSTNSQVQPRTGLFSGVNQPIYR